MSEYVTEEDLKEPVCDCGHPLLKHSDIVGGYCAVKSCKCIKRPAPLRLAHLDSIVRREVAKALHGVSDRLDLSRWYDPDPRGRVSAECAAAESTTRLWLRDHIAAFEAGGQS